MTRRLPPEVEKWILEVATTSHNIGVAEESGQVLIGPERDAQTYCSEQLRTAILAACDAAERRGIERAAKVCTEKAKALSDLTVNNDGQLLKAGGARECADAIDALPVSEEGVCRKFG